VRIKPLTAGQFLGYSKEASGNEGEVGFKMVAAAIEEPAMTPEEAAALDVQDYLVLQGEVLAFNGLGKGDLPLPGMPQPV